MMKRFSDLRPTQFILPVFPRVVCQKGEKWSRGNVGHDDDDEDDDDDDDANDDDHDDDSGDEQLWWEVLTQMPYRDRKVCLQLSTI